MRYIKRMLGRALRGMPRLSFLAGRLLHTRSHRYGFLISYSQLGEDMIIKKYFDDLGITRGVFVDAGCNHPIQGNNTFRLYLEGWRGINIDANESLMEVFRKVRPGDVNLCEVISNTPEETTFYISEDTEISTVSERFKKELQGQGYIYSKEIRVRPRTLEEIVDKHLQPGAKIDLLTIDVEGHDLEVLQSLNFRKHRPELVCIEDHDFTFENLRERPVVQFLFDSGYHLYAAAPPSLFFARGEQGNPG